MKLQVILLAALIAAIPLFSQPLSLDLITSKPEIALETIAEPEAVLASPEVNSEPLNESETAEPEAASIAFSAPALEEHAYIANRSGEFVSYAMSSAVDEMTKQAADSIPAFTDDTGTAYVKSETAVVYSDPLTDSPEVTTLPCGTACEITGNSLAWLRVEYQDKQAYVLKLDVSYDMVFVPSEGTRYVQTTDPDELFLMAGPSMDSEVVKDIWFADRVTEVEKAAEWTLIETESGHLGYVPGRILTSDIVFVMDSTTVYATQELAVYAGPDDTTEPVHYYKKNDNMFRDGYSFDWCRVVTADEEIGYVKMELLTTSNPFYVPPVRAYVPRVQTVPNYSYSNASIQTVVNKALSYVGGRYVLGGMSYSGIDCSGLVYRAYEAVGIYLPRLSYNYWGVGRGVSLSEIQPGDVVCYDSERNGSIGHVAIYIGNGQVVHAMNPWSGVGTGSVYFGGYTIKTVRRLLG